MRAGRYVTWEIQATASPVDTMGRQARHSEHSSFREKLIEHLLIGELLKYSWKTGDCSLEISRPEVDRAGYDLVAENGGCLRHLQLKGSEKGATTATQKVHVALAGKPSGCVVWVHIDDDSLRLGPFLFFGGKPGMPLPGLKSFRVSRHTRGNAQGVKAERPNHRNVPKGKFESLDTIEELWSRLFGDTKHQA